MIISQKKIVLFQIFFLGGGGGPVLPRPTGIHGHGHRSTFTQEERVSENV